ncbi:MAG: hypothetical protein JRF33_06825, partial [Deltaproteobacteria bacterium]|nr:hypothetical protein [Deltaproteobacteria bacterium]
GNACTVDQCDAAGCSNLPVPDGDECGARFCNGLDWMRGACLAGECNGTELVAGCADGNVCTLDQCDVAGCSNTPVMDGTECGLRYCDALAWMSPTCLAGNCSDIGLVQSCDDGNICTIDDCDAAMGCSYVDNNVSCDDLDACTMDDTCSGGSCTGAPLDADGDTYVSDACGGSDCNDLDPLIHPGVFEGPLGALICSDGIDNDCDELIDDDDGTCLQCLSDPDCDDGDVCNGAETCVGVDCVAGTPLACDDELFCNGIETCDPVLGCLPGVNPCPQTQCKTCQEAEDTCFDSAGTSCEDDLYCTLTDTCDGSGNCLGADSPCQVDQVCHESTDTCEAGGCGGQMDCTPCNDGLFCTADDFCIEGECLGFGDPCGEGEVCNWITATCEPVCGTDCSGMDDACNTGICNPTSGSCELLPKPVGTPCSPEGGQNYMFCTDAVCTHWCNHSYQIPGDSDHECPIGYTCKFYRDADSAGYCLRHPLGGTKAIGEDCTSSDECRAYFDGIWSTCDNGRCTDTCSSSLDCRDQGPDTSDWICQSMTFQSAKFDHGTCGPPPGTGQTGDVCSSYTDCIDGRCYLNGDGTRECRNMCCTEAECIEGRVCWFWVDGEAPSTIRLCTDMGPTGTAEFGTPCTGTDFFDSSCATGLCLDLGDGERCNRFCCRDTDCPTGSMCEFAFILPRAANKDSRVRVCVPAVPRIPTANDESGCIPGDKCGMPITLDIFPASVNDDNTDYSNYLSPHGTPMVTCVPPYNYYGRDVIYEISVASGRTLTAILHPPAGEDLGVYLMDICDPDFVESNCLAGSDDGLEGDAELIEWINTGADAIVYLVVDAWSDAHAGPYVLNIDLTP